MITNAGLNYLRDALYDGITHVAVGDSDAEIENPTQLGNEIFRVPLTDKDKTATGVFDAVALILDVDGPMNIREIGVFANGTSAPNSGTLISRVLWNRNKTALETIQVSRTDTIVRG